MPRKRRDTDLKQILRAAATLPDEFRLEDLDRALDNAVPRTTLLRRVKLLERMGRVRVTGAAKATRYSVVGSSGCSREAAVDISLRPSPTPLDSSLEAALSSGARAARNLVRRSLQDRVPVGYDRQLLELYIPNETRYMPPELSASLLSFGKSVEFAEPRPAGTYARQILDRLLIDLSWNSSRLDGNTYSLLDTRRLINEGLAKEGGTASESQMILNHKAAIEFLVEGAVEVGFNPYTIRNLHAIISDNLLEHASDCGAMRTIPVAISGSVFLPLGVPLQIAGHFEILLAKADAIVDPFEQALFVMAHLPYLQPFVDGNKRTSRLAANIPFIKQNLCPLSFVDVPEGEYADALIAFYELGRVDFLRDLLVWAYERSAQRYKAIRQSFGEPDPFRLRYRQQLIEVVAGLVREGVPIARAGAEARSRTPPLVAPEEVAAFAALVEREMADLHEGNFARFRLRPSEFRAWKANAKR